MHTTKICTRTNFVSGFLLEPSKTLISTHLKKTLPLVHPIIEYGSIICSSHHLCHNNLIDMVQKCSLHLMGVRSGMQHLDVETQEIARQHRLLPFSSRRTVVNLLFLFKIVNGLINCQEFIMLFDFHEPIRTRFVQTFSKQYYQIYL